MFYHMNKYKYLGFIFILRKSWYFGNDHRTIFVSSVLGFMILSWLKTGMFREKNISLPRGQRWINFGLFLSFYKSIWVTGKVLVLDSGFCALRAITEILKVGLFSAALTNKNRYRPKCIHGDFIKQSFYDNRLEVWI